MTDQAIDLKFLHHDHKVQLLELLNEYDKRLRYNKLDKIFPDEGPFSREFYPKQVMLLNAGKSFKERALFGGNQSGKSFLAAYEVALHATGLYPHWWQGIDFDGDITIVCACDTHKKVAEVAQSYLMGNMYDIGTGMIPKDRIISWKPKPNVPNAISEVLIRRNDGGVCRIMFLSYDAGRTSFQGFMAHFVWLDEEPHASDIYSEALTRTINTGGRVLLTYTPLSGLTEVTLRFLPNGQFPKTNAISGTSLWFTQITWDDAPHLREDEKKALISSYQPWEIEARTKGVPSIGEGKIYPILEKDFVIDPFKIPLWWPRVYALDVGFNVTAAVWGALDEVTDTIYIYDEAYLSKQLPSGVAAAIKGKGDWIPGVVDPSAYRKNEKDGVSFLKEYQDLNLDLEKANNAVNAGITAVLKRMSTGRLKIMVTCPNLISELRLYRYGEDGKPAKNQNDHACDTLRYLIMSGIQRMITPPNFEEDEQRKSSRYYKSQSRNGFTGY